MSNTEETGVFVRVKNLGLPAGYELPLLGPVCRIGSTFADHLAREDFYGRVFTALDSLSRAGKIELTYRDRYEHLPIDGKTTAQLLVENRVATNQLSCSSGDRLTRTYSVAELVGSGVSSVNGALQLTDVSPTLIRIPKVAGYPTLTIQTVTLHWRNVPATWTGTINMQVYTPNGSVIPTDDANPVAAVNLDNEVPEDLAYTLTESAIQAQIDVTLSSTAGYIDLYSVTVEYKPL